MWDGLYGIIVDPSGRGIYRWKWVRLEIGWGLGYGCCSVSIHAILLYHTQSNPYTIHNIYNIHTNNLSRRQHPHYPHPPHSPYPHPQQSPQSAPATKQTDSQLHRCPAWIDPLPAGRRAGGSCCAARRLRGGGRLLIGLLGKFLGSLGAGWIRGGLGGRAVG